MGSFTKIYLRSYHPEDSLTLSWDIGYRNVSVYDGKRLVKNWEASRQFINGVSFQDEKLGNVQVKFADSKPIQLEVKVNGKRYKPSKDGKQVVDTTGQASVFWALMVFTVILLFSLIVIFRENLSYSTVLVPFGLLLGISAIYFFTAYLMSKKMHGAFFIGYSYVVLHLIFLIFLLVVSFGFDYWIITFIYFLIRLGLFLYFTASIKNVVYASRNTKAPKEGLIDENI
jgi:hypothetical protein